MDTPEKLSKFVVLYYKKMIDLCSKAHLLLRKEIEGSCGRYVYEPIF